MFFTNFANQDASIFEWIRSFNLYSPNIIPNLHSRVEIDAMLILIGETFIFIPLKVHVYFVQILYKMSKGIKVNLFSVFHSDEFADLCLYKGLS